MENREINPNDEHAGPARFKKSLAKSLVRSLSRALSRMTSMRSSTVNGKGQCPVLGRHQRRVALSVLD